MKSICCALMLLLLAGCGSGERTGDQPVYKVSGVVKYKGTPVAGADIIFFSREHSLSAFGRTNEQGEYSLMTYAQNDGAVAGQHIVTISKTPPPNIQEEQADTESEAYVPPELNAKPEPVKVETELPGRYASQELSGLLQVVKESEENKIDFDLKD